MQQATDPTSATASPEPRASSASLRQAYAVAGRVIPHLATLPRDLELKRELDGEYRLSIFWSHDVSSVAALAAWADDTFTLTPSETGTGIYAETRPRIGGIEVWAWTLLSSAEAAEAELLLIPRPAAVPDQSPTDETPDAPTGNTPPAPAAPAPSDEDPDTIGMLAAPALPPLGSSVTFAPGATTVPTTDGAQ